MTDLNNTVLALCISICTYASYPHLSIVCLVVYRSTSLQVNMSTCSFVCESIHAGIRAQVRGLEEERLKMAGHVHTLEKANAELTCDNNDMKRLHQLQLQEKEAVSRALSLLTPIPSLPVPMCMCVHVA